MHHLERSGKPFGRNARRKAASEKYWLEPRRVTRSGGPLDRGVVEQRPERSDCFVRGSSHQGRGLVKSRRCGGRQWTISSRTRPARAGGVQIFKHAVRRARRLSPSSIKTFFRGRHASPVGRTQRGTTRFRILGRCRGILRWSAKTIPRALGSQHAHARRRMSRLTTSTCRNAGGEGINPGTCRASRKGHVPVDPTFGTARWR
jgi:hypothetical protein